MRSDLPRFLTTRVVAPPDEGAQLYIMIGDSFRCQRKRSSRVVGTSWEKHGVAGLDGLKEQVAYLKLWQGIAAVTFISLLGRLISARSSIARCRHHCVA